MSEAVNEMANDVPEDYVPYDGIDFCGSQLISVKYIIEVRKFHPLLIGRAKFPYIWISAPTGPNQDVRNWIRIIERSTAKFPVIDIDVNMDRRTVSVRLGGKTLLLISNFDENAVSVSEVDLRPVGLLVYGSDGQLNLAGMPISNSTVNGANSFLAID
jgi:hypothetical protein